MRRFALCVTLVTTSAACDAGSPASDREVTDTAVEAAEADTTSPPDVAPETEADVAAEVADPCDPNPCTAPQLATCSLDRRSPHIPTAGLCTAVQGAATCAYPTRTEACDVEGFCSLGECLYVGSVCDYPTTGIWSYGTSLRIAGQSDERDPETGEPIDQCCADLDGDGSVDNAFGDASRTLNAFLKDDLNDFMERQMKGMVSNLLLQVRGLPADAPTHPTGRFDVLGLSASDINGTTYETAAAGNGVFRVSQTAFLENTSMPRTHYELVVEEGVIVSGSGVFGMPSGVGNRNIDMEFIDIEGTFTYDPGRGVTLDHADGNGLRLATVITQAEWLSVWNTFARENCTCTVFPDGNAYDIPTATCTTPLEAPACEETDDLCKVVTDPMLCNILINLLPPDLDRDGDGKNESISSGIRFKSVPATVVPGVGDCP